MATSRMQGVTMTKPYVLKRRALRYCARQMNNWLRMPLHCKLTYVPMTCKERYKQMVEGQKISCKILLNYIVKEV